MSTDIKEAKEKVQTSSKRREGDVARTIESETARIPSDVYLWASLGSMAASLVLKILNKERTALFIGQWAPSFLILGLYNKIVKVSGHDKKE